MIHARKDYDRVQDPALEDPTLLGDGSTPIGKDEPVFLLRAKDRHASAVVAYYAMLLAKDPDVDSEMAKLCLEWSTRMRDWGIERGSKAPDMPEQ